MYRKKNNFPARTLLVFSLPLFASAIITLLQGWGDITLLQLILGQFGTTGAYCLVVSSISFLSILDPGCRSAISSTILQLQQPGTDRSISETRGCNETRQPYSSPHRDRRDSTYEYGDIKVVDGSS